jgi:hypothetical protein
MSLAVIVPALVIAVVLVVAILGRLIDGSVK